MKLALEQLADQHATRRLLKLETEGDKKRVEEVARRAAQAFHGTEQVPTLITILELTHEWKQNNDRVMKERWMQASLKLVTWRYEAVKSRRILSVKQERALERCVALTQVFTDSPHFETLHLYEEYIKTLK